MANQPATIHVWERAELSFSATNTYANPFREVTFQAEFRGPDGRLLVVPGFWDGEQAYTIVRLGWEMNGNWFEWSGSDPAGFISCYQHIATDIRATDRWVVMDWTQNAHGSQTCNGQAINCYPGDAYVDVIGIDNYDMWPGSPDQAIWDSQCNGPDGMCTLAAFARRHHKMFGVGEWSVAPGEGVNGGGDNPFYIQTMFKFFVKNADILLYENYFNFSQGPDGAIWNPNDNPLSADEYQKLYSIKHFRTTKAE